MPYHCDDDYDYVRAYDAYYHQKRKEPLMQLGDMHQSGGTGHRAYAECPLSPYYPEYKAYDHNGTTLVTGLSETRYGAPTGYPLHKRRPHPTQLDTTESNRRGKRRHISPSGRPTPHPLNRVSPNISGYLDFIKEYQRGDHTGWATMKLGQMHRLAESSYGSPAAYEFLPSSASQAPAKARAPSVARTQGSRNSKPNDTTRVYAAQRVPVSAPSVEAVEDNVAGDS